MSFGRKAHRDNPTRHESRSQVQVNHHATQERSRSRKDDQQTHFKLVFELLSTSTCGFSCGQGERLNYIIHEPERQHQVNPDLGAQRISSSSPKLSMH